jgi:hypothetical protein
MVALVGLLLVRLAANVPVYTVQLVAGSVAALKRFTEMKELEQLSLVEPQGGCYVRATEF